MSKGLTLEAIRDWVSKQDENGSFCPDCFAVLQRQSMGTGYGCSNHMCLNSERFTAEKTRIKKGEAPDEYRPETPSS